MSRISESTWPALPIQEWQATCTTLHLWTQVIGKIRLALTPWLNHSWHVPLYVSPRGLRTSTIPYNHVEFELTFDFIDHALEIDVSTGTKARIALRPQSVAHFYEHVMSTLEHLGITVAINELPAEIPNAVLFSDDHEHASYDPEYANRFWRVLIQVDRVFKHFRTGFVGKASPVHFFWGSFDLAVTRFSGRRAPPFEGKTPGLALDVMREAYSHEVSSAGFWPGAVGVSDACFYSYAYPQPEGYASRAVEPADAHYSETLKEFVLPYEDVRVAANPDALILAFLQSTYVAAASAAEWDRGALECSLGVPGKAIELPVPNPRA
ncbi:MAG: DUF5996 family protein [Povalibacter sp.]